ncbi:tyrosine-type recombinase/integrase [Sphingomonas sp. R86521]|uniref:tyrosine-type recombinase/integrase n=1 Tax=Sphingomonas sp. R86521 TaxID=3093860 RepID=UPI0036D405DC
MPKAYALSALAVKNATKTGRLADGGGLYLLTTNGGKRWVFIFRWHGKRCEMGLGSASKIPLASARKLASAAREQVALGRNPIDVRNETATAAAMPKPQNVTFGAFADEYISSVEAGWRNPVHRKQWRSSLRDHAGNLSSLPIGDVDTDAVLAALQPIWLVKPETAGRVRGRIEKILSAAKVRGLRPRDSANPAAWRGHLDILLPKRPTLSRGHHPAVPYNDLPILYHRLQERPATAARALSFLILCASRSGEVIGASWGEVQGDAWVIPAERMKGGRVHTVTLSPVAVEILAGLIRGKDDDFIFHGGDPAKPLSNMALSMLMRRMGYGEFTAHGFRSSYKDWVSDMTDYPDELSEEALAHIVGSKVRRAYRRGEALERRRAMMNDWATFVTSKATSNTTFV